MSYIVKNKLILKMTSITEIDKKRIHALNEYQILDSLPEKDFDDIVTLASQICNTPISYISFIDDKRQWLKAKIGLDFQETTREDAFCNITIQNKKGFVVVPNISESDEYKALGEKYNITEGGFYAGIVLKSNNGIPLGTLCVFDLERRTINNAQLKSLKILANQVIKLLDLRKKNLQLNQKNLQLTERYKELEDFAKVVSHDLKSPLNNIISLSNILKSEINDQTPEQNDQLINYILNAADELSEYINAILNYYKNESIDIHNKTSINLKTFLQEIIHKCNPQNQHSIILYCDPFEFPSNSIALEIILSNLITNAIKYNDKPQVMIEIKCYIEDNNLHLSIADNGIGIAEKDLKNIFGMFTTLGIKDRYNKKGTGIGLATVSKIVSKLNGSITVDSEIGKGSVFSLKFQA